MDPDALRQRMIELANRLLGWASHEENLMAPAEAVDLAEAVHDMDGWLRGGGFLPAVWTRGDENRGRFVAPANVDI